MLVPTLAASVLVGAAACSDDDPEPAPTPTTTEPSTTTTEAELTDEEAVEQLLEDWFEVARRIGFGDEPVAAADAYLAEPYLSTFRGFISGLEVDGHLAGRLDDRTHIEVESVEVDGDSGIAVHCSIDADVRLDEASGEVVDDRVVSTRLRSEVVRSDGRWLISGRVRVGSEEGEESCPA